MISRWYLCTLKFGKHWSRVVLGTDREKTELWCRMVKNWQHILNFLCIFFPLYHTARIHIKGNNKMLQMTIFSGSWGLKILPTPGISNSIKMWLCSLGHTWQWRGNCWKQDSTVECFCTIAVVQEGPNWGCMVLHISKEHEVTSPPEYREAPPAQPHHCHAWARSGRTKLSSFFSLHCVFRATA